MEEEFIKDKRSKMIRSLEIQNFQSHIYSFLEFDKGINIITGQSDSGKSAIIRAIRWLIENKPQGDSFRNNFGGDTIIEIQFEDNNIIDRIKTNKKNSYKINENFLYAFGFDVPEDVKNLCNMSEINIQKQLEEPFLLSKSSGEVSRYLNEIVDLDLIDLAMKNIDSKIREIKEEIRFNENEIEILQNKITVYSWLTPAKQRFELLKFMYETCVNLNYEISTLEFYTQEFENIEDETDIDIEKAETNLNDILIQLKSRDALNENIKELTILIKSYYSFLEDETDIDIEISVSEKELNSYSICPLCGGEL